MELPYDGAMNQPEEERHAENEKPDSKEASTKDSKPMTPEDQMAQFEDALKEDDWGHQPC